MPVRTPFNDLPLPQQAGMLACDETFRAFAGEKSMGQRTTFSEGAAAEFIRTWCRIPSRRDLATDTRAAARFETLRTEFDAWRGRIPRPETR